MSNLDQFYTKYPVGSRTDTDGAPSNQPYQCVDLIKRYLNEVFNLPIQSYGNANQYWTNKIILQSFSQITDGSKQQGDILVWGDDPGTFTGPDGHIAIWYNGQIYNQNYNNSGKISLNNFFSAGYLGTLRSRENLMTKDQATQLALYIRLLAGESVSQANGHTTDDVAHILADPGYAGAMAKQVYSGEWQPFAYKATHYDADIKAAQQGGSGTPLAPGNYVVKG